MQVWAAEPSVFLPQRSTNGMRLGVYLSNSTNGAMLAGAFEISAFGRPLLTDRWAWSKAVNHSGPPPKVLETILSNQWEYALLDLTPSAGPDYTRWHRHLLFAAPDLFVIYDDADLTQASRPRIQLGASGPLVRDLTSLDFRLETAEAGMTAHVFTPMQKDFGPWQSNTLDGATVFQSGATNRLRQLRVLTLVIPHAPGRKGGTGFKMMESDTAIGGRVWRNGLPTLFAFRTSAPGMESNLASMPVPGAAAVDIFDPQPAKRRKLPPGSGPPR